MKEGEVKHSMEGRLAGALAVLDGPRQASWTFSLPNSGPPLQHYPLEVITWHAGLAGDRRTDTSLLGNLTLIGEEHEDWPDNKLTPNQIHWTTEISKFVRANCPVVGAAPPTLRRNLWEHRWLSATSCPSGLIPWTTIIEGLEDDMTDKELLAAITRLADAGKLNVPVTTAFEAAAAQGIVGIDNAIIGRDKTKVYIQGAAAAAVASHGENAPHGGGGYTDAQAVEAVRAFWCGD